MHAPSPQTGRDGRPLIPTNAAAYSLTMTEKQFRDWARRRRLTPAAWRPNPVRGQRLALWDPADITDAVRKEEGRRKAPRSA